MRADPPVGIVPDQLSRRLLSARLYDADWMMLDADVLEGTGLDDRLRAWFRRGDAHAVHVHTARRGCYLAAVVRA